MQDGPQMTVSAKLRRLGNRPTWVDFCRSAFGRQCIRADAAAAPAEDPAQKLKMSASGLRLEWN